MSSIKLLLPLPITPKWACCQIEHNYLSCPDCQELEPAYADRDNSKIRTINLMFFESTCRWCGCIYQWHREHRNQCPDCHVDFGFMIDLSQGLGELKDHLPQYK